MDDSRPWMTRLATRPSGPVSRFGYGVGFGVEGLGGVIKDENGGPVAVKGDLDREASFRVVQTSAGTSTYDSSGIGSNVLRVGDIFQMDR